MSAVVILSTTSSKKEAQKIAKSLLGKRLAACVNILPAVESHFIWQGKLQKTSEFLLLIKSKKSLYPGVERLIRKMHAYDVPEVISLPITAGSKPYLSWLDKVTEGL